ncbi:hypothetical protein D9756_000871 [Leucocoprinus leucothites]|uniref:Uncharacterized protein n=1 Tax=Leucocoprinus leucothites TaxID=201217 RepID=A0A8H5GE92_9AGAR|nr:hypothetical protein D9756_000871 [Leucoagaricus leucothites]
MLSLFPPPGPSLPPFSTLLVKGTFHRSAPLHLAIGHVNESPENEVLILSPSRERLEQKLASGLDEWLFCTGTTSKARTVMSRITILYPPSPVHFSLLVATLDGNQSNPELMDLWAELPVMPTENLSMIILDDISSYFAATDQAEASFISLINRVMQSANRISRTSDRTNPISIACFEPSLFGPQLTEESFHQRSSHMEISVLINSQYFQSPIPTFPLLRVMKPYIFLARELGPKRQFEQHQHGDL